MSNAPFAVSEANSRGRRHPEAAHPYRDAFDRDRDRIIHCAAFRRLEGKTQVFTTGLNDQYRTRLTHSIEVAQIGRTLARNLGVNESLTEAICLAHDLGHPPFGHAGEAVLDRLMAPWGGFEHNRQSFRIVEVIEHPYPDFAGLNLMYETRLGLRKHTSPYDRPATEADWPPQTTIEGQIADLADRIAYNCHDLEDGIRARLIEYDQVQELDVFDRINAHCRLERIEDFVVRRTRLAKGILDLLAIDAIETSRTALTDAGVTTWQQATSHDAALVCLSEPAQRQLRQLESFLLNRMYHHPELQTAAQQTQRRLETLFEALCRQPDPMPSYYRRLIETEGLQRAVCDYIAGMTDRFCIDLARRCCP